MYAPLVPSVAIQPQTVAVANSAPLSDGIEQGAPRRINKSVRSALPSIKFKIEKTFYSLATRALPTINRRNVMRPLGHVSERKMLSILRRAWSKKSVARPRAQYFSQPDGIKRAAGTSVQI